MDRLHARESLCPQLLLQARGKKDTGVLSAADLTDGKRVFNPGTRQ